MLGVVRKFCNNNRALHRIRMRESSLFLEKRPLLVIRGYEPREGSYLAQGKNQKWPCQ